MIERIAFFSAGKSVQRGDLVMHHADLGVVVGLWEDEEVWTTSRPIHWVEVEWLLRTDRSPKHVSFDAVRRVDVVTALSMLEGDDV